MTDTSLLARAQASNRALTILTWLLAAMYALSSVPKILQMEDAVAPFIDAGLSAVFVSCLGLLELTGAVGLLVKRTSRAATVALIIMMIGAVAFHLFIIGGSPAAAILALAALGLRLWLHTRHRQT